MIDNIHYKFHHKQGQEHPHPGKRYFASGFPRLCYLPDNTKGQKVCIPIYQEMLYSNSNLENVK